MLFRKRTQNPEGPPASVPLPDEDAVVLPPGSGRTVIGTHTRIRGTLTGEGSIVVRGTVEGGIAIGGGLTVTASGTVQAEVEAESVALAGEARGSLRATSRVILSPSGLFEGEMATPILEVHPGSVLKGRTRVAGVPAVRGRGLSH